MPWQINITETADKQLARLGSEEEKRIRKFLRERLAVSDNPKNLGEQLTGDLSGLWRYRVGNYRIICTIEDEKITILILRVGHRREVYR